MTPTNVKMYSTQYEQDLLLELPYYNLHFQTARLNNTSNNSEPLERVEISAGTGYYKFCLY